MRVALLLLSLALASVARAALEFSGYVQIDQNFLFVVTDKQTGAVSDLLKIDSKFQDYRLVTFDASSEILTLDQAGVTIRLPLKQGRIRSATPQVEPSKETHIAVSVEGDYLLEGQPITLEALFDRLRQGGAAGDRVELYAHYKRPASQRTTEALQRLLISIRKAGLQKWTFRPRGEEE